MDFEGTSRTLNHADGALHYHEAGNRDGLPLLLLHGSGPGVSGWSNFGANLPVFAEQFRTLVLDLPGYGKSAAVAGHPVLGGVQGVLRFMDALGIERAHIVGNSYGAIVAAKYASEYPDRIARFVTIGGFANTLFSPFPAEGILRLVEFIEDPTREKLVTWMQSMVFDPAVLTDELIDMRYETALDPVVMATSKAMYTRAGIEAIAKANRGPHAIEGFSHLTRIQAPTLVTWGRDDRVNPLDGALLPMRFIPNCELHVFPNCGHWAMIERKTDFESVALSFLTRAD